MIKKVVVIGLGLLICLGSLTCSSHASKKIKVGVCVATMQEEVYSIMKKAMEESAPSLNAEIIWTSSDNNEGTQVEKVENLLTQGIDVLILHPVNMDAATVLVDKADKEKVPVVGMDRCPKNRNIVAYVTADSYKVGVVQAEYVAKKLGGKGNIIILSGDPGNPVSHEITKGNEDVFAKYPEIRIVFKQWHKNWSAEEAMANTENILTKFNNNIAAVVANNDGMALGALQAVKSQKLEKQIITVGADCCLPAAKSVLAGELTMTVNKFPEAIGTTALKVAVNKVLGKPINNEGKTFDNGKLNDNTSVIIPLVLTPVEGFDKENINDVAYRVKKFTPEEMGILPQSK